ncbi:MAG: V-type ATP synthase subunit D [Thermodesulfobacteriota bacterium]
MREGAPTRRNLMILKRKREVVGKGRDLLKSKREALMKEFLGLVEECLKSREDLSKMLVRARRNLELARAVNPEALDSLAITGKRNLDLDIEIKNVWGVKIPAVLEKAVVRSLEARELSPLGESAAILDTVKLFEEAVDKMLRIATPEVRLSRVGEMIKSDTRKINAIEEVLLPRINMGIKATTRVLEEREKEDVFRMKRYKMKRPRWA